MAGPDICVLCLADTCTSEVHPVFNPVAPYGYLLSDMYLLMADTTNPDFLVESCRTWIGLDITRFCEQQRQPSSGSACQKNGKSGPHCWGRGGSTQFAQQFEFAVTAPPLVGCVVWSLYGHGRPYRCRSCTAKDKCHFTQTDINCSSAGIKERYVVNLCNQCCLNRHVENSSSVDIKERYHQYAHAKSFNLLK